MPRKRLVFICLTVMFALLTTLAVMAQSQSESGNPWNQVWSAIEDLQAQIDALLSPTGGRLYVGIVQVTDTPPAGIGGYDAADAICNDAFEGSYVCTVQEIFESRRQGLIPTDTSIGAIVNSGMANSYAPNVADCKGWTSSGTVTSFNSFEGEFYFLRSATCTNLASFHFACCE